jgi:hypothetical protein
MAASSSVVSSASRSNGLYDWYSTQGITEVINEFIAIGQANDCFATHRSVR